MTYNIGSGLSTYNPLSFGAVGDGVANDSAAWGAVYAACPNDGTVLIPQMKLNEFGFTTTPATKSIMWQTTAAFDYGTNPIGTAPVFTFTDGDLFAGYWGGRYNFIKNLSTSTNGYANVLVNLNNACSTYVGSGGVFSALQVNAASTAATASGVYTWSLVANLFSGANGGGNNQDVAVASAVWKTGASTTWQFGGQSQDSTGTNNGSIVVMENDTSCNGAESAVTAYNPGFGGRTFYELDAGVYQPPNWAANTAYIVGANQNGTIGVVTGTAAPGNLYTYICTVAGTSGATQPVWPTAAGTVTDGTVTWAWGATIATETSRAIAISSGSGHTYGAGLWTPGNFYNACIDLSWATLISKHGSSPAAIRMAANQLIDFTGNQTLAGQNVHTFGYKSADSSLNWTVSGVDVVKIFDTGAVTFVGGITTTGPLNLTNGTSNAVIFSQSGLGAPSFTTRSSGTKIVLYPDMSGSTVDYAIGVNGGLFWNSVQDSTGSFGWFAGTTQVANVSGTGGLTLLGSAIVGNGAASINSGTGAATGTQPKGSIWMRTDGSAGTHIYISQGAGTWTAIAPV
jgi:hypothetical protein